jgi:hypothetical protein
LLQAVPFCTDASDPSRKQRKSHRILVIVALD